MRTRTSALSLAIILALTLGFAAEAAAQRPAGVRAIPRPATTDAGSTYTGGSTATYYFVHAAKSLPEACAYLNAQSVLVTGDAEWPFLVIERVVSGAGASGYQAPPYYATRYDSHASAGNYVDTWRFYRTVRLVTADDGAPLVVERLP